MTIKATRWTWKAAGLAALALAVPSVGLAFSTGFDSQPVSLSARGGLGSFTPASVDPRLASSLKFSALRDGRKFRFTPAGSSGGEARSVTVAVRVNPESAAIAGVRTTLRGLSPIKVGAAASGATTENLGMGRGWSRFALPTKARALAIPDIAASERAVGRQPVLREITLSEDLKRPSRFNPSVALDAEAKPGRPPRTFDGEADYRVDVGGSYKISRNLDVTAGVRYTTERDRIEPLTNGQQDSQAVYVGTKFRF